MAVTIDKKFWNGTEYKNITKVVFTSPNFDSPAVAGTRSHMPPGGKYMGTWFEAVDFMYRQFDDQDYANFPDEMESFFGKLTLSGTFDLDNETSANFYHKYGEDYDVVGSGVDPNILYKNKDNYGIIESCVSGTTIINGETFYTADINFSSVVGSGIMNEWMVSSVSGVIDTSLSGVASYYGEDLEIDVITTVSGVSDYSISPSFSGTISGTLLGAVTSGAGTVSGVIDTSLSGVASYYGEDLEIDVITTVAGSSGYLYNSNFNGTVSGTLSGTVASGISVSNTVYSTVEGLVSGTLYNVDEEMICDVEEFISTTVSGSDFGVISGNIYEPFNTPISTSSSGIIYLLADGVMYGNLYGINEDIICKIEEDISVALIGSGFGTISGTVNESFNENISAPNDLMYLQYSDVPINSDTVSPRPRRHHGGNSIIFSVTFGEAYDCRLTAWDDDTHSTTNNKILDEEHYKVDVVAYKSNAYNTAHEPVFMNENCLVYPPAYNKVLKGDDEYYGDFDLVYSINDGEYGEYLAFTPRLINMDDSFTAGSYDFITSLHYQYT